MFCLRDVSQRAPWLVAVRVLLALVVLVVLLVVYLWVGVVFVLLVLVQVPGLLLPICVLGLRGGCLVD